MCEVESFLEGIFRVINQRMISTGTNKSDVMKSPETPITWFRIVILNLHFLTAKCRSVIRTASESRVSSEYRCYRNHP